MILTYALSAVIAYLVGSVSFSIIITRRFAGIDVRSRGSGNAGTTNVLRTAGKLPALLTFSGDFLKCVAALEISRLVAAVLGVGAGDAPFLIYVAGICCIVGHVFPLYFGFRGGKGVAASAAVMLLIDWRSFLIAIAIFVAIVLITRIVSLGSLVAAASLPVSTLAFGLFEGSRYAVGYMLLITVITAIIFARHSANIARLARGTEPRICAGKRVGVK